MTSGGRRPASRAVAVTVLGLLALTACEGTIATRVDQVRAAASQPALPRDALLDAQARTKAGEMCASGTASPTPDPLERYDAETAAAVDELVGRVPLDLSITEPGPRNGQATDAIWEGWADDPTLVDPRWDSLGVGEQECADGHLAMALVLRDGPSMPASGRYSTAVHPLWQITQVPNLEYRTAIDHLGQSVSLQLDIFLPPAGEPAARPTLVLVHGGGFHSGSRENLFGTAREYARRGFVTTAISYRLQPNDTPEEQLVAAADAIDDSMEAIRYLKANATTYGIDTTRIGVLGLSAGGAIALALANLTDPSPTGPLAAYSPTITAAVSTGASLTSALSLVDWDDDDAPALMYHYEVDTSTGDTDEVAFQTCAAMRSAGTTCDFVVQPGAGHTTPIGPQSTSWVERIGPFLWAHLRLS
jgi:acetyl esterase/lipase